MRVEFFKAFRQTSNHAYINGAKQNKLAKLLEESGEEGQRVMTAFTQWATSCPRPMKQQLAALLKKQKTQVLRHFVDERLSPSDAENKHEAKVESKSIRPAPASVTATHLVASGSLPSARDIAQHGRIHKRVPKHSRKLFTKICREVLRKYAEASSNHDKDAMLFYFVSLLQLPARTLLIRPRTLDRVRYGERFTLNKRLKDILHALLGPYSETTSICPPETLFSRTSTNASN